MPKQSLGSINHVSLGLIAAHCLDAFVWRYESTSGTDVEPYPCEDRNAEKTSMVLAFCTEISRCLW
jgi:hypothetical protein